MGTAMTHFLLATLVTCALHAGLPFLLQMVSHIVFVAKATGTTVNGIAKCAGASLPLLSAIQSSQAAGADGAGRA